MVVQAVLCQTCNQVIERLTPGQARLHINLLSDNPECDTGWI